MFVKMKDMRLDEFEAWSYAKVTKQLIIENGKESEFENLMEELYPDGMTETQLNDILRFEDEWICKSLRIQL